MPSEYYRRWRREHPRLQIYLSRDEYGWLRELAKSRGVSMRELVLDAIMGLRGYEDGFNNALDLFIEKPSMFYNRVMERARLRGLGGFEPALFTAPCKICGGPMIFTYKDKNWAREGVLHNAFSKMVSHKMLGEVQEIDLGNHFRSIGYSVLGVFNYFLCCTLLAQYSYYIDNPLQC